MASGAGPAPRRHCGGDPRSQHPAHQSAAAEAAWASQLDSETGKSVLDVMRDATRSGTAILLATHDQAVIEVADRVQSMEDGRLVEREPAPASP